ncbi:hypothetical protein A3K01_03995 [candidate division WWE3 bacterium RIFOXYD1_FULL_43_17]|uniref:DUF5659 domain-containing protein n=1 Tax=candidate division WWE3 bacterium RIFOXYD1_FULL_43_17 TaxID=1802652 RepID=A0A1F4XE04_UNCKA|nr:MAG: hypothetical protein A3K01_03995 [candidate division WWE3 bacterium RIFOXYD1_FULL_43_17]
MNDRINNKQINTYRSTDLAITSFLSLSFNLIALEKVEGNRYEFVFERTPELEKAIESFFNNTAKVSPTDYFNSIKSIKSRIYSRS